MARREFPTKVRAAVIKRSTKKNGQVYCEGCGKPCKKFRVDHRRADGLLGEPTLENAQLLGPCCYEAKDKTDTKAIAKAKRREARHIGAKMPAKKQIASPGFRKTEKHKAVHVELAPLPPRRLFEKVR